MPHRRRIRHRHHHYGESVERERRWSGARVVEDDNIRMFGKLLSRGWLELERERRHKSLIVSPSSLLMVQHHGETRARRCTAAGCMHNVVGLSYVGVRAGLVSIPFLEIGQGCSSSAL